MKKERHFLIYKVAIIILCLLSCAKDEDNLTVTDIDGNIYHTITIGSTVWMMENLKVTKYNDGTEIPNVTGDNSWANTLAGAYCNYNNDSNMVNTYGRLYNWYAINSDKLCPKGWHIPTIDEWPTFISARESADGFPAVPAGYRSQSGKFNDIGNGGYWWTINEKESDKAFRSTISIDFITLNSSMTGTAFGFSVRCVKD